MYMPKYVVFKEGKKKPSCFWEREAINIVMDQQIQPSMPMPSGQSRRPPMPQLAGYLWLRR